MTDAPTQPSTPAVSARPAPADPVHRNSAALIVAATLSFVGAAITVAALFPDYWDAPSFSLIDDTASLAQTSVFAGALIVAGMLLLARWSAPIGAAMLVIVVAFFLQPRVDDIATLADANGPRAGTGFSLVTAGFVLALFAAVMGSFVALRPRAWSMLGGARPLAVLAALFGFATAVGYAMNPFTLGGSLDFVAGGSPLSDLGADSARYVWAAVLVVVLLAVVPPVAIAVGGRIGSGLALGVLFGIGGIAALRLGAIYGGRAGAPDLHGAEGTWTFHAASGAVLIVTWFGLAAGGVRRPRAVSMQPVSSDTPSTEPVVTGDDPSAIVAAGDASGDDSDTEATDTEATDAADTATTTATPGRVEPMAAADSTTTSNAADSAPDHPAE
jgi:hypothetical protein